MLKTMLKVKNKYSTTFVEKYVESVEIYVELLKIQKVIVEKLMKHLKF